jgi:hypothetical protein
MCLNYASLHRIYGSEWLGYSMRLLSECGQRSMGALQQAELPAYHCISRSVTRFLWYSKVRASPHVGLAASSLPEPSNSYRLYFSNRSGARHSPWHDESLTTTEGEGEILTSVYCTKLSALNLHNAISIQVSSISFARSRCIAQRRWKCRKIFPITRSRR